MPNRRIALALPLPPGFSLESTENISKSANNLTELKQIEPKKKVEQRKKHQTLWLCLFFPDFPLEVVTDSVSGQQVIQPQAVVSEQGRGVFIHTVCDVAREYGVTKNMPLNAAYALCPELKIFHRDREKESATMSLIADWAQTFTSHVSIISTNKILLEVKGSLRFFSGLESMLSMIENSFPSTWSHRYQMAVSPTPLASQLLCEMSDKIIIEDEKSLRPVVGDMPIDSLLKDNVLLLKKIEKIKKTGVKTVQDLWRLPRDGLARRFGVELLKSLDQLTGVASDLRVLHQISPKFERSIELPMETSSSKIIIWTVNRLFENLETFLRKGDTAVVQLNIHLKHLHQSTELVLRLRQMARSAAHMSALFSEKMERTTLSAKVVSVSLMVDEILPFIASDQSLFVDGNFSDKQHKTDPEWENTLEQLQNRLGPNSVKYLHVRDEAHPGWAWCYQSVLSVVRQPGTAMRPLWLLNTATPLPLCETSDLYKKIPDYHGPLSFLQGPERIESGWWRGDEQSIMRDYYIALSQNVGYLWIYRDLKQSGRWYLHGFFG
ncbi:MAG: DNA polymerase Y family protein [Gammaproteobacteria bacterium]|nr:DNA polymerase Y family protein [Gammaproteobacteria bacterium]